MVCQPGVTYQLESKNSLLGENWLSEKENPIGAAALDWKGLSLPTAFQNSLG